jgi:hypothetical protein
MGKEKIKYMFFNDEDPMKKPADGGAAADDDGGMAMPPKPMGDDKEAADGEVM